MAYNKDEFAFEATALQGAGALKHMLDYIGGGLDRMPAEILVRNEMPLRALLTYALTKFADEL